MNVTFTAKTEQGKEGHSLIQQATRQLEEILGHSAGLVSVQWDRVADKWGRGLYRLTLKDFTGEVSTEFAIEELRNPLHLHARLYQLWGDLLQRRSDEQHKVVQTMLSQVSTDEGSD